MADFGREYGVTPDELADLSSQTFWFYMRGLSQASEWRAWAVQQPHEVEGEDAARVLRNL